MNKGATFRGWVIMALAVSTLAFNAAALAQDWPNRPIRLIVPFAPGGGTDLIARMIGPELSERLGQPVVVENRAGANGIVGLQLLMTAKDEHTFSVMSAGPLVVNPHVYQKLPYDTLRDFTAISNLATFPLLLATHPKVQAGNLKEFIALAKTKSVTYSSPGVGNTNHLAGELFASMAGVSMVHVPYKGSSPAVAAVYSGEVDATFTSIPTILPFVRNGQVNVLGVGNAERISFLPEIPSIAEAGLPGYEAFTWVGLIGPAGLPRNVIARLNKEVVEIFKSKEVDELLLGQGAVATTTSPEAFDAYIRSELTKWGEIAKRANIKLDN